MCILKILFSTNSPYTGIVGVVCDPLLFRFIFFTQLPGLSRGFGFEDLGFGRHRDRKRLEKILTPEDI